MMKRFTSSAIALLFVGIALAGCTGGNTGGGGTTNPTGTAAPPQAVVTASPLTPTTGTPVSLRAAQALPTDTATWMFGDGEEGTGLETTHTYATPGHYIVHLTISRLTTNVTNDAALTYITVTGPALELANITEETPPFVTAASSQQVVQTGGKVEFDATGSGAWIANPDFDPSDIVQSPAHNPPFQPTGELTYAWDFGDGAMGEGLTANHTFATEGLYAVKLTGTTESGDSASYFITVRALPTPPTGIGVRAPTTLITATIGEPESLDPAYDYESSGGTKLQHLYETLYYYKRDSADQLEPRLAASLPTVSADGTEYTIKLRTNVKFHTGNTMTADDVVFSFNRAIIMNDPDGPAWILGVIKGAEDYAGTDNTLADRQAFLDEGGVMKVDDATVKITLAHADPSFVYKISYTIASVVDMKAVCDHAEPDFVDCLPPPGQTRHPWMDTHEVGTGPFQLDAWIPGQQFIMKRFDSYWGNKPTLEKVIFQKVEDINTRLLMLFSGQADDVYIPVDHDVDVIGKPNLRITENPSWAVSFIGLNQKFCGGPESANFQSCMTTNGADAPKGADGQPDPLFFSDLHMRKAWTYAFDYDTYYKDIAKSHGRMLNGPLPQGIFGYDDSIPQFAQDLTLAADELRASNHPGGFSLTLYFNSGNTVREKGAQLLAQNIEQVCQTIGATCDVNVQGLDFSTAFLPKQRAQALPVFYLGWLPDYAFPDNYVVTFAHSEKGVYSKRISYANPELDAKLDALALETDTEALKTGWSEAVKTLNDDYAFIWLIQSANYHVERDWVHGYYYNPMHSGGPNIGDYTVITKG